jgi:hypothetical protein
MIGTGVLMSVEDDGRSQPTITPIKINKNAAARVAMFIKTDRLKS